MITFKQFLHEEEETDKEHASVMEAAAEYLKHCKRFKNLMKPLYRLSGESWMSNANHKLKTRVPRTRRSESRGGSAAQQAFLFSLPGWEEYPPRRQSIFCSTTREFVVDSVSDDGSNLLMIYPFDGVKIAVLPEEDLNTMNIARGFDGKPYMQLDDLIEQIAQAYVVFRNTEYENGMGDPMQQLKQIKHVFTKNGKFDPEANGNDELADKFAELEREDSAYARILQRVATQMPEKLSPEAMGVKLVTSDQLDLPGNQREVWFSGKYLSVPYRFHDEFKQAVIELDNGNEDDEDDEDDE